jgi:O-antigen/teichoic acid export membrane protein
LALLPIFALGELRGAALRGLRLFIRGQAPEAIVRPGLLLLLLGVFWALPGRRILEPDTAMVMYLMASAGTFAIGAYWLWHALPPQVKAASAVTDHVAWRKMATALSVSRGGRIVLIKIDLILVGMLLGPEETGVFRVAGAVAMIVAYGLSAVNTVAAPYFSHIGHKQRSDLRHMLWFSSMLSTAVAVPIMVVLAFFGSDVIRLLYGKEFVAGYVPLLILAAGQLFNAVTGPAGSLLNMTGHERWVVISVWVTLAITLPLYFVVVPRYGMTGAAWVTTSGVCILNIFMWLRAWVATRDVPIRESTDDSTEGSSL